MIYGKPYGGSAECKNCESVKWTTADDCYLCGKAGCDDCMSAIEDEDPSVGYRETRLVCEDCKSKREAA